MWHWAGRKADGMACNYLLEGMDDPVVFNARDMNSWDITIGFNKARNPMFFVKKDQDFDLAIDVLMGLGQCC
jgi:ribosomal protein S9